MIGNPLSGTDYHYRHLALETCVSTNSFCMDLAQANEPSNLWVTATLQTSGRGSRGREWTSDAGNLFASLLLRDASNVEYLSQLTFVTAVSVSRAIASLADKQDVSHKWPNDIMLNGKKCCGILLENKSTINESTTVIGIGVNCVSYPESTLHPATSLKDEGIACNCDQLFEQIAIEMARYVLIWNRGNNFQAIRNLWLEKAYGMGEPICIKIPGQTDIHGIFNSIDENGILLLELPDATVRKVSAADIFFT